ncbi:MAG: hypothetical protein ACI4JY_01495 [Oscillospiraceae bacterium]
MQLKYSFKKELAQFFRTFRFLAVVLVVFSFAVANPLMFKFTDTMLKAMNMTGSDDTSTSDSASPDSSTSTPDNTSSTPDNLTDIFGGMTLDITDDKSETNASVLSANPEDPMASLEAALGDIGMEDMFSMYSDAGLMFATSISTFSGGPLLVIMLLLLSAAGGEQKKRAMIVPMCSGLQYKSYLLPKFVIYPLTVFATVFLASMTAGGLCNLMFPNNHVSLGIMLLSSVLNAIYMVFILCIFLSLGLCSSKPGVMAAVVYVGQLLVSSLLNGIGLTDYQPFALLNAIGGGMVMGDFSLAEKAPSIIVSALIAIVVCVLMYFLALGVLGAKKTDNQAEKEPEF